MKKNKRIKALILTPIAVILAFVITVVIIDRFFWMHFDYYFCTKPDGVSYYVNEVTDKTATIWLYQRSSAAIDRYGGYDYKVQGNTIYLGINVTYFWGQYFEMPTEIPIQSENKIEKIILCGKGKEKVIYVTIVQGKKMTIQISKLQVSLPLMRKLQTLNPHLIIQISILPKNNQV